jgi:signal transduction histidine kinase
VRSRTKKAPGAPAGAPSQQPAAAGPPAGDSSPAPAVGARNGQPDGAPSPRSANGAAPAGRGSSRRSLKNWRVRSRLLLLIIVPTVSAIALGGISIASSIRSFSSYQRVDTLATLGQQVSVLAQALEDERDQTAFFIGMGTAGGRAAALSGNAASAANELTVLHLAVSVTNRSVAKVRTLAAQIGTSYSPEAQQAASQALTALNGLPELRSAATKTQLPVLVMVRNYTQVIDQVLALDNQISQVAGDAALAQTVRVLGLVTAMQENASQQRALLATALLQGGFGPGQESALESAQSSQSSNLTAFNASADLAQQGQWSNSVDGAFTYQASADEDQAITLQDANGSLAQDSSTPEDWYGDMSNAVDAQMGAVSRELAAAAAARAKVLRNEAIFTAVAVGTAVVIALLLALIFITVIGRSMVRPLRALRAGALEVAGLRLPEAVRQMNETGAAVSLDVEPIEVDSSDEIGEVARAFDQVHREALRLAANEAALRGNVNAMFVNLSRRSQSLVERQIQMIDDLEQGEQDAERLSSLFQMDHLATRMRRNSENLLVLAGHDSSRRWNQPVALVDVLRAAVSEIEQYERVSLNVQPGISVRGHAVNDTVHLLAELAENATSFSSAETPVTISGHLLSSGGVLLDITDQGVGMGAEEMAHANWRLDNPPVVDVAVSRRMGLFVVARLAARHGVRVRLRPAASGGLTALVWLPDEVVSREGASPPAGPAEAAGPSMPGLAGFNGTAQWTDERAATAQEVSAARTPKFASLQAESAENGKLGPRRVPGSGPRPGQQSPSVTGPLPAFPTSPQPAGRAEDEPFATSPQRAVSPDIFDGGLGGSGPATGPVPAFDESFSGWPEPPQPPEPKPQPSGNGYQLPKRQVDRAEPGDSGPARGSSTDMFSRRGDRGAGGDLFGFGQQPAAEPPVPSRPVESAEPASADLAGASTGQLPAFNAPVASDFTISGSDDTGSAGGSNGSGGFGWDSGLSGDQVVVPPAEQTTEYRLPIFESVESDWFRRGRSSVGWSPQEEPEAQPARSNWTSPADEGWQAAAAASAPSSGGTTTAGLPKRVPKANLVPGTAAADTPAVAPPPARSASATRDRFASFQRGVREGRAAVGGDPATGEDDGSR